MQLELQENNANRKLKKGQEIKKVANIKESHERCPTIVGLQDSGIRFVQEGICSEYE